jgi:hypothetical protein
VPVWADDYAGGLDEGIETGVESLAETAASERCELAGVSVAGWVREFSVSASNLERVMEYIQKQEEHHRKTSFQDELRVLLRKHAIEWKEEYLWD